MDEDFLKAYETELGILYERGDAFARRNPDVAGNLGMLTREHYDPSVKALLEGTAFMAARVQVKLNDEFNTFTEALLEQIVPDVMAPVPSAMLVSAMPKSFDKDAWQGRTYSAGELLSTSLKVDNRSHECLYRLSEDLSIWPVSIDDVDLYTRTGPLEQIGIDVKDQSEGGLVIDLSSSYPSKDGDLFAQMAMDSLKFYITADDSSKAAVLYELIHTRACGLSLVYFTPAGDAKSLALDPGQIHQIGFDPDQPLYPTDSRVFSGFNLLKEYFSFRQKFLGFEIRGLQRFLKRTRGARLMLVMEFEKFDSRPAAKTGKKDLATNCTVAVNVFPEEGLTVVASNREHDLPLPDQIDREFFRVTDVKMNQGQRKFEDCLPLYRVPVRSELVRSRARFDLRHRTRTADDERRLELHVNYAGSDTLLSIYVPEEQKKAGPIKSFRVDALCTNRLLPALIATGKNGVDQSKVAFRMMSDHSEDIVVLAGPTMPRPRFTLQRRQRDRAVGPALWRLVSMLSLNYLGLGQGAKQDRASNLREMLSLFAPGESSSIQDLLLSVVDVECNEITGPIRHGGVTYPALGTEISITMAQTGTWRAERALLGAILDRFLAEYAAVNSFTRTVIKNEQGDVLQKWPNRNGRGGLL